MNFEFTHKVCPNPDAFNEQNEGKLIRDCARAVQLVDAVIASKDYLKETDPSGYRYVISTLINQRNTLIFAYSDVERLFLKKDPATEVQIALYYDFIERFMNRVSEQMSPAPKSKQG